MERFRMRETSSAWIVKCPATGFIEIPRDGRWQWDGDRERPTFTPSVNETTGKPGQSHEEFLRDPNPDRNHVFITRGRIEYLTDCTHPYAGSTVEIEPLTEAEMRLYWGHSGVNAEEGTDFTSRS